jgi:hypothetical protein
MCKYILVVVRLIVVSHTPIITQNPSGRNIAAALIGFKAFIKYAGHNT